MLDENKDAVNYVLKWITHLIFKPETKMTTGLMISGGQGTGKTTISSLIRLILSTYFKLNVFKVSIDDFYKTRKERKGKL